MSGPAVHRGGWGGDALGDDADLELVVREHPEQVLLGDGEALERLLLLDDLRVGRAGGCVCGWG